MSTIKQRERYTCQENVTFNIYKYIYSSRRPIVQLLFYERQIPIHRPRIPHLVLGQKILHPRRPHGGRGGATTGTGTGTGLGNETGAFTGAFVGALVGVFVGALVGVFVGALVGAFVGALVGTVALNAAVAFTRPPPV
jgi:hypothetical protein